MRAAPVLLLLLFFLATMRLPPREAAMERVDSSAEPELIEVRPIALHPANDAVDRIGALRFLNGWVLTSADPRFGGISALAVRGHRLRAVSDAGSVILFDLDGAGAISNARISALPDGPEPEDGGDPQKRDRDAEAMALDRAGTMWIGFERANAIWRYANGRAEAHAEPVAMRGWPDNGGPEAMVRLDDGRFLVFAEQASEGEDIPAALIFEGDPAEPDTASMRFEHVPPIGFAVTDAALLPDRRLLLLNRRFTMTEGPSAIFSVADIAGLGEGDRLVARPIATLTPPLTIDNMEALAVSEESGRIIVWIASDDNFNPLQRTLLLKFELMESDAPVRRSGRTR